MSIRQQLLAIALTTLLLPWAGCEYARQLEAAQRIAQENALEASADTIAHALAATPERVVRPASSEGPFDARAGDLYVFPLRARPLLDGYLEDWALEAAPRALPSDSGYRARALAGGVDRFLYLYVEVDDPHVVPEPPAPDPGRDAFTRIDLALTRPDGLLMRYFFASGAPGPIGAQTLAPAADGPGHVTLEPRIQGFWLQTAGGYHLEVRIPLSLVGERLWLVARAASGGAQAGVDLTDPPHGGRLYLPRPELDELLGTFIRAGTRATVIDADALKVATAGTLEADAAGDASHGSWYRSLLVEGGAHWPRELLAPDRLEGKTVTAALHGHPAAEWLRAPSGTGTVLVAAAPLLIDGASRGAVVLEQSGAQLIELRDRALTRLLDLTLLASLLAVGIAFAVAASIGFTISRLRNAADTALEPDGRIRLAMPESGRRDEIGALARAFERLLGRLNEHTQYLRSLGGKLSHELRTPLTIVRSSIDNLESEGVGVAQQVYLARAREGVTRLQSILSALGAAARVEESIQQAERVPFDLSALLATAVEGYHDAFPSARIRLEKPEGPCPARGAPDLILQLLDKLIENAVDFCPPGGQVTVRLERSGPEYRLCVENDGPSIPAAVQGRLFESLFEHRPGRDEKPHFGLGLYIVRLIAEFHGGRASAANRADGGGAVFTITLPLV